MSLIYQGWTAISDALLEVRYFDDHRPIFVRLPRRGLERLCNRSLSDDEIGLVLISVAKKELFQLMDRALARCGGFNGGNFRRLDITMVDIEQSGLTIPITLLNTGAAFVGRPL
jgi:hypothetical protein